jgi:hypothetical protein
MKPQEPPPTDKAFCVTFDTRTYAYFGDPDQAQKYYDQLAADEKGFPQSAEWHTVAIHEHDGAKWHEESSASFPPETLP